MLAQRCFQKGYNYLPGTMYTCTLLSYSFRIKGSTLTTATTTHS